MQRPPVVSRCFTSVVREPPGLRVRVVDARPGRQSHPAALLGIGRDELRLAQQKRAAAAGRRGADRPYAARLVVAPTVDIGGRAGVRSSPDAGGRRTCRTAIPSDPRAAVSTTAPSSPRRAPELGIE
jgi:hypothetical protein